MMHLKKGIPLSSLLQRVRLCAGQVWFLTDQGDRLNLKSTLSEFVFLSAAISSSLAEHGVLELQNDADRALLEEYLEG